MEKLNVIKKITDYKIVAVVRGTTKDEGVKTALACFEGGIKAIEITMTNAFAIEIIKELSNEYANLDMLLGAGTIINHIQAREAIAAGAKYIIGPGFDLETAQFCQEKEILYIPGCFTITEILQARKYGCKIVKLFPANLLTPSFAKVVLELIPDMMLMPTGGVNLQNIEMWLRSGACAVGTGSNLTNRGLANNYQVIIEKAEAYVKAINELLESN